MLVSTRIATKDYSISNFLTKLQLDSYMKDARGRSQGSSMLISLIDSVMAFGYQAFLTITQRSVASDERKKADYYSKTALRSRSSVLRSANTLLKLQVSLLLRHCRTLRANRVDNSSNGWSQSSGNRHFS